MKTAGKRRGENGAHENRGKNAYKKARKSENADFFAHSGRREHIEERCIGAGRTKR